MNPSESAEIACPYCGESIAIVVDASVGHQEYIEDCQVCCKPIRFRIHVSADGAPTINVRSEDE